MESGTPPADICGQLGVSEATFYIWKKKCAHLGVSELRKRRSLEDENARLKRLVADLMLDKHMLAEALRKKARSVQLDFIRPGQTVKMPASRPSTGVSATSA